MHTSVAFHLNANEFSTSSQHQPQLARVRAQAQAKDDRIDRNDSTTEQELFSSRNHVKSNAKLGSMFNNRVHS
jgi:hypothetical protein